MKKLLDDACHRQLKLKDLTVKGSISTTL